MEQGRSTELPGRIEIELTEHDASASRRRWRHADEPPPAGAAPSPVPAAEPTVGAGDEQPGVVMRGATVGDGGRALGSDRRRLVVTALAVGAVALFVGWALGRSGAPGEIAAGPTPSSRTATSGPATTTPSSELGERVPPVASVDLPVRPTTTAARRRVPTVTITEEWVDDTVEVDPRLAAAGVELVALTAEGVMSIDVGDGARSTYRMRTAAAGMGAPRALYAGDGWILVHNPDAQRADVLTGRDQRRSIMVATDAQLIQREGGDTFLTVAATHEAGASTWIVREVPYDGSSPPLSETAYEVPGMHWVQSPDPAGGALVVAANGGGTYLLRADGTSQRLTTGMLLGLDARTVVVNECGDVLGDCHIAVVDRATGERREAPKSTGSPTGYEPLWGYWGILVDGVSPTGEYVPVTASATETWSVGLLAVSTGEFISLAEATGEIVIRWSPDGRFAFYVDRGKLMAYDTVERTTISDVVSDLARVVAFTVRPVAVG